MSPSPELSLDPPIENKRIIIENEIVAWKGSLYQARTRYRVRELIGDPPDVLATFEKDIARCLKALDAHVAILQELVEQEQATPKEQPTTEALIHRNGREKPVVEFEQG